MIEPLMISTQHLNIRPDFFKIKVLSHYSIILIYKPLYLLFQIEGGRVICDRYFNVYSIAEASMGAESIAPESKDLEKVAELLSHHSFKALLTFFQQKIRNIITQQRRYSLSYDPASRR